MPSCSSCQAAVAAGDAYCSACGVRLELARSADAAPPAGNPTLRLDGPAAETQPMRLPLGLGLLRARLPAPSAEFTPSTSMMRALSPEWLAAPRRGSTALAACLIARLRGWRFPRPPGGAFAAVYPFAFTAAPP